MLQLLFEYYHIESLHMPGI